MAAQKKAPAKKAAAKAAGQPSQTAGTAGGTVRQVVDQHPRPVVIPPAAELEAVAAVSLEAVDKHQCTPTRIKKTGSNGDETRYRGADGKPNYIGNYHKGLPHNDFGEVIRADYQTMLKVLKSGTNFDKIPLRLGRQLTNPQAGLATDVEGPEPKGLEILAAPRLDSAEAAAEAVELYWMALLRDVPFIEFDSNPKVAEATDEISRLKEFTGPKIGGKVTPQTIFRGCSLGDNVGPYLSQFLLHRIDYGSLRIDQLQEKVLGEPDLGPAKADYMTTFPEWLAVQRGKSFDGTENKIDTAKRVHIYRMRDLARYVQVDALYEAYLNACLILLHHGAPWDPGNPYEPPATKHPDSLNQIGFGTFGGPHILSLVTEVATRALKAIWYQKWFVHRRLRPEAYGGLIHVKLAGGNGTKRDYPIHEQVLNSKALAQTHGKFGSYLLPMAFPEGSPTHPAYGAGHATVAGACVTILKAWFDDEKPLPRSIKPKVPNADGTALVDYTGPDAGSLTIEGELNKVAANIAIGRNMAGVHWRSDYTESVKLGERVALSILYKQRRDYNEKGWSFSLTTFEGERVTVTEKGVFDSKGRRIKLP